jgi:site-specific DNA-methyltransferase (adenine-specific)
MSKIELLNVDCMEFMRGLPDKFYSLAIVDPPYGIMDRMYNGGYRNPSTVKFKAHIAVKRWDCATPDPDYFTELFRVAEHAIIWGGNYFNLPPSRCVIAWDKMVYVPTMSQIEMAWTTFDSPARLVKIDNTDKNRIHPTQKPVALYRWLLKNYAKPGQRILDTHGGSMSIAIACDIEGYDLTLCELDPDYFAAGKKRLEQHQAQPRLFDEPKPKTEQLSIGTA